MKLVIISILSLLLSSCASMFNTERQQVQYRGGPENGVTQVSSPDGTYHVENGQGAFMMTRSKPDIPLSVTCPNGEKKSITATTRYDWAIGWLNIFNYGLGFLEAIGSDKAYKIDDVVLNTTCSKI